MDQGFERSISTLIAMTAVFLLAELLLAGPARPSSVEKTVTSKRTRDLVITIRSRDGTLAAGENRLCVTFQKRASQEPVTVSNVSVDFTLLVGRIEERPIRGALIQVQNSQYCGTVNLGKQYYDPSNYYVFVRYSDATGKRLRQRLFVSIRSRARDRKSESNRP